MTPGLDQWVGDPALLWLGLWRRLAAVAPTGPLAWERPYATGVSQKAKKKKEKKRKEGEREREEGRKEGRKEKKKKGDTDTPKSTPKSQ